MYKYDEVMDQVVQIESDAKVIVGIMMIIAVAVVGFVLAAMVGIPA